MLVSPAFGATRADILRGAYGPYRANNDLLFYHLDVRVDPDKKFLQGKNTIRFRMLRDGKRIQLDLHPALQIDKILFNGVRLGYRRDAGAVFVDFPQTLKAGTEYSIDFYYSGHPVETGRFGAITFRKDPTGHPWINTACEETGASVWWPNKDQWRDEVESMQISVSIPNGLVDVSNGKFMGTTNLGDGYTRWDWMVHYPINNYDVSMNIGNYVHFSDGPGVDFYVLPADKQKAEGQFTQARQMLQIFGHYFGDYPFPQDGYKLIEVPYSGMEHQTAVTYGNHFTNGYLGRDWTNTGISMRFDFIIIHESAHEWFGNSITAADRSDMWIHEGWATYLESLYVESRWGRADALKYLNGLKPKVRNLQPIISQRGVNSTPPEDQYFKGALFLNTLRSVIDDDARWWALLHDFYQHFKYQNIMTEDVVQYFNQQTQMNLTPIFNQYLRHAALPVLELQWSQGNVRYRWQADDPAFAMPVFAGGKQTSSYDRLANHADIPDERSVRRRYGSLLHQGRIVAVMMELSPVAARVLGSLVEKEITTPEYYPLSMNALANACNQKNNREPVTNLEEDDIRQALHRLEDDGLAGAVRGTESRVAKYEHHMQEVFNFTRGEIAVMCVLLLRGPQTPGELRGRTERMHRFEELSDVQSTLQRLMQRDPPLVMVLPRQPGTKEARYAHLLSGEVTEMTPSIVETRSNPLEAEVAALRQEVAELRAQVEKVLRLSGVSPGRCPATNAGCPTSRSFFARCGIPLLSPRRTPAQSINKFRVDIRHSHISRKTSEMWGTRFRGLAKVFRPTQR